MEKSTFTLETDQEYIQLIQLLKHIQIASSGGHAKMMVEGGLVYVNTEQEFRKRKKLRAGDVVELEGVRIEITA